MAASPYRGYRFPEEIISQCVWLYFNLSVSLRDVELMMAYRGVQLSYETVRRWCDTFGAAYAAKLKRRRPRLGDKWHLDEVFLKINGVQHYLWRAVDQEGAIIDILVQPKRDRFAAVRFFRKLLRSSRHRPRVIITDKLRSYGAAKKVVLPRVTHRQSRYLNNRAENSHQPTRQRERRMKRRLSMRSVFSKYRGSWPLTSDRNDICFLLRTTKPNGNVDSRHGARSSQPKTSLATGFSHHLSSTGSCRAPGSSLTGAM